MRGAAAQAAVVKNASESYTRGFFSAPNVTEVCHNVVLVSKLTDTFLRLPRAEVV